VAQGLAAESRARGFEVLEIDLEGDPAYDLLDEVVYYHLLFEACGEHVKFRDFFPASCSAGPQKCGCQLCQ